MHRQWVALVDDENPNDSGTQGYLQLSIAIVGPGDKLKVNRPPAISMGVCVLVCRTLSHEGYSRGGI